MHYFKKTMLGFGVALISACVNVQPVQSPIDTLHRSADEVAMAALQQDPWLGYTSLNGVSKTDHTALPNISPEAINALQRAEDEALKTLQQLNAEDFSDRSDWALYHGLQTYLTSRRDLRVCQRELWSLNHLFGWQATLPKIAEAQPTDTAQYRSDALERWQALPAFLEQDMENLRRGVELGYTSPKSVVRRITAQLDGLLENGFETSPLTVFARHDSADAEFREAMRTVFEDTVLAAITQYRDFLKYEYLPAAREDRAISSLPNGEKCYEAYLKFHHTADFGAELTFERGLATVAQNQLAATELGRTLYGTDGLVASMQAANSAPENQFTSKQDYLDFARALVARTRQESERYFWQLPTQPLIVEPYPEFMHATGLPPSYQPSTDTEAPGIYRLDPSVWEGETKSQTEVTAVHEGWPGHHLQVATAYSAGDFHPVLRMTSSTAYLEGWARYAEGFAEEIGIYKIEAGGITRRAWPARGMVIDPGIHVFDWSDEQAIDYLLETGQFTPERAEAMLDRIAVLPGQLTAYDTGGLEFLRLRRDAELRLGDLFDIRDFHDRILENGAVPLGTLSDHVVAWIERELEQASYDLNGTARPEIPYQDEAE